MRNWKGNKWWKRVVSVGLVGAMVLGMVTTKSPMNAEAAGVKAVQNYYVGDTGVIRGVMNQITDLPQYQYQVANPTKDWRDLPVGKTTDRPFFILEIVPYIEYGEFGYLVGGCEPLAMDMMGGLDSGTPLTTFSGSMNVGSVKQESGYIYFFEEEPEAQLSYYGKDTTDTLSTTNAYADFYLLPETTEKILKGYYEFVGDGNGKFKLVEETDEDGNIVNKIVSDASGNIVWHTMNAVERSYHTDVTFNQILGGKKLNTDGTYTTTGVRMEKLGDRCYTTRSNSATDRVVQVQGSFYYYYENNELFIRDVIGLKDQKAVDSYSVVYKAITTTELNSNPEWADYADLIYINAYFHNGSIKTLKKYWNAYNRTGKNYQSPGGTDSDPAKTGYKDLDDLSYNSAMHIFNKVAADSNHAGLLIDDALFELFTYEKYDGGKKYAKSTKDWQFRDFNLNAVTTKSLTGRCENIYKLLLMTCTVNTNIVKQIFLPHIECADIAYTNPSTYNGFYLVRDTTGALKDSPNGKMIFDSAIQTGDLQKFYWPDAAFQLIDKTSFVKSGKDVWNYLNQDSVKTAYWNDYNIQVNETFHNFRSYVQGRVYAYNSDTSIAQVFRTGKVGCDAKFSDYNNFLQTDAETRRIWTDNNPDGDISKLNQETAPPSSALRYILGLGTDIDIPTYGGEIRVLDIEPSTDLLDSTNPKWTVQESLFHMLLPNFTGTITVDHYTMPAFVGKVDDLNSIYSLVYLGSDVSGFRTDNNYKDSKGRLIQPLFYNDTSLNDKIYHHIGDVVKNVNYAGDHAGRPLNIISGKRDTVKDARLPGNDITKVKVDDFKDYLSALYPIVADEYLFDSARMDTESTIYKFVHDYDFDSLEAPKDSKSGVFHVSQAEEIEKRVKANKVNVTFNSWPTKYNESNYLPIKSGDSYLEFSFTVDTDEYGYNFYVDQDRNGKFESGDIVIDNDAHAGLNKETYPLSDTIVGLIQWRIEVYKKSNPNCRASMEGCSAAKNQKGTAGKETINVLQVKPSSGLTVNLADSAYKDLYSNLDAFTINVDIMTWDQFESYFHLPGGEKFKFDMGEPISNTNPVKSTLDKCMSTDTKGLPDGFKSLDTYNMFVFGFADMYGNVDMSDANGAVEFIYYFAQSGKGSVLFTHDTTSMYNTAGKYGSSSNAIMRDVMGMNRYGMDNYLLDEGGLVGIRSDLKSDLQAYRTKRIEAGLLYDTTSKEEKQGFTYAALMNMAEGDKSKFTLKYMQDNGFNQNKGPTKKARELNEGQITTYPYVIDEILDVAQTHCQLYQLNMEDPELTVWYTLWDGSEHKSSKAMVSASPQDAANQYYIYSKGNIFYTGVGHSGNQPTMERKLFVNTMIAAFRARYMAPVVQITNSDRIKMPFNEYILNVPREFEYTSETHGDEVEFGDNYITVYFRPMDSNFSNDMKVRIRYKVGDMTTVDPANVITSIKDASGNTMTATAENDYYILHLKHGHIYHFNYPKSLLSSKYEIYFECVNDRSDEVGETNLKIMSQPLFMLD